jgi:glycosyltransferase involved in cell wall biosynthesis
MERVDVIIPTYKRPVFLKRAIDSVLSQSHQGSFALVVDDNSDGDPFRMETEAVMREYAENEKVVYLKHEVNKNGAAARNTGIRYSNADFIAFLDDDDFYLPNKVRTQLDVLRNFDYSWGGICCNHVRRYNEFAYKAIRVEPKPEGNYCYDFLSGQTSMPSSTLLFRSEVFDKVGYFDESFQRHQDWEFLVRYFRHYKLATTQSFDLYMQVDGFRNYPSSEKAFKYKSHFLDKYEKDIYEFGSAKATMIYKYQWIDVACLYLKEKKYKKGIDLLKSKVFKGGIKKGDIIYILFFLIQAYLPSVKRLSFFVLGLTKYREFSGNKFSTGI